MIEARIQKRFPASPGSAAFDLDVQIAAAAGSVTLLFGSSGAGKTLTLESIAGFLRPDHGRIELNGRLLFDAPTHVHLPPQKRACGYVFQNYALFPHMTLRANLAFAAERLPRLERHRKVAEMIERFRLDGVAARFPHELSGGQRQRASIARALLAAPQMLLLDEPSRGLDAPLRSDLYEVVRTVRQEFQLPILLVTHDLDECFALGDSMYVLHEGKIVQHGSPQNIAAKPANLDVLRLLGLHTAFEAEVVALDPANHSSRLRVNGHEIAGPYFPGRFKGDRLWIYILPQHVAAEPRLNGRTPPNKIPAALINVRPGVDVARLEFSGGWKADIPQAKFQAASGANEWLLEFPVQALLAL